MRGSARWILWVLLLAAPAAAGDAGGSCDWADPAFYSRAEADGIRACIRKDGLPAYRSDDGETPLHLAAANAREPDVVEALLRAGVDPTLTQADGRTALHRAAEESDLPALVSMLVLYGADVDRMFAVSEGWFGTWGTTPLHLGANRGDGAAMVAALLAAGADTDARSADGRTPLHVAARIGETTAVIDLLLANGANVDAEDEEGWRALHFAAYQCDGPELLRRLLEVGADPDAESDIEVPQTPLRVAASQAQAPACFSLLVKASEAPCARDDKGRNGVDLARDNDHLKGTDIYWALHDTCAKAE